MAYCVHMILWIHENHVHKCFSFFNLPNLKKNQLFQDYYYNYFFIAFSWVLHFSLLPSLTLSSAQGTQAPSFLRRPCLFFFFWKPYETQSWEQCPVFSFERQCCLVWRCLHDVQSISRLSQASMFSVCPYFWAFRWRGFAVLIWDGHRGPTAARSNLTW